jgi:hypothetical protein
MRRLTRGFIERRRNASEPTPRSVFLTRGLRVSRRGLQQCLRVCRRRPGPPSWSVGNEPQSFASGCIATQMMVYGRSRKCKRSGRNYAPQRRPKGTEKSLCRQGDTCRVAPTLLTCPTGFAVCARPHSRSRMPGRLRCMTSQAPCPELPVCNNFAALTVGLGRVLGRLATRPQTVGRGQFRQGNATSQMAFHAIEREEKPVVQARMRRLRCKRCDRLTYSVC